jgi:hypothetical protein
MDLLARHFGAIAHPMDGGAVSEVDIRGLVNRLILFDECIIESHVLREIPDLVKAFCTPGLVKLIESSALRFIVDSSTIAQIGQAALKRTALRGGPLELGSFHLVPVEASKEREHWNQYLGTAFSGMSQGVLSRADSTKLRYALQSRLLKYPGDSALAAVADSMKEILNAGEILALAIRESCVATTNVDPGNELGMRIEDLGNDGDFRVATNLRSKHGLTREIEHKVVERAVLTVAGFEQRIDLMSKLEGITGFTDNDVPLLESKLTVLGNQFNSLNNERSFHRIIEIGELDPKPTMAR